MVAPTAKSLVVIKSVCPSGGALAAMPAPMAPPCAGQIFDVELLAEVLRHFLRHYTRDQIGRAAGRIGYDDAHRAGRIVGRSRLGMACAGDKQRQQRSR